MSGIPPTSSLIEKLSNHPNTIVFGCGKTREPVEHHTISGEIPSSIFYDVYHDNLFAMLSTKHFKLRHRIFEKESEWTLTYLDVITLTGEVYITSLFAEWLGIPHTSLESLFPLQILSYKVARMEYPDSYVDVCCTMRHNSKCYAVRTYTTPRYDNEVALSKFHCLRLFNIHSTDEDDSILLRILDLE